MLHSHRRVYADLDYFLGKYGDSLSQNTIFLDPINPYFFSIETI